MDKQKKDILEIHYHINFIREELEKLEDETATTERKLKELLAITFNR